MTLPTGAEANRQAHVLVDAASDAAVAEEEDATCATAGATLTVAGTATTGATAASTSASAAAGTTTRDTTAHGGVVHGTIHPLSDLGV